MAERILEMRHVTKRFPGVLALNDISITLDEGEILGYPKSTNVEEL